MVQEIGAKGYVEERFPRRYIRDANPAPRLRAPAVFANNAKTGKKEKSGALHSEGRGKAMLL
jgi:hypothetical protein